MSENKMAHKSENHSTEKQEAFEVQQDIMGKIMEIGFAKYAETLPNLPDAFDLEKHKAQEDCHKCVCCMDGRTPFGIHAAGSGILLEDKAFDEYFEKARPDSMSSHTGCGAAKLYCKKMGIEGDPDEVVKEWTKRKAAEKGVKYIHLEVEQPFHSERACYYDGTGKFNYKGVEGLPEGFVVGRKNMSKEASLAEAGVAKNIILGDHGFGPELLTKENPFIFVAVAKDEKQLRALKLELTKLTKDFGDSVAVDGFIAPQE
jgi:hypothetical protein